MQRCLACQSVMTPTETTCVVCGTPIKVDNRQQKMGRAIKNISLGLFWAAAASGVVGLFMENGPPVKGSFLLALLLLLLRSSATEMVKSDS